MPSFLITFFKVTAYAHIVSEHFIELKDKKETLLTKFAKTINDTQKYNVMPYKIKHSVSVFFLIFKTFVDQNHHFSRI